MYSCPGKRAASQRTISDGFQQCSFPVGFDSSFDQITHRESYTRICGISKNEMEPLPVHLLSIRGDALAFSNPEPELPEFFQNLGIAFRVIRRCSVEKAR